MAVKEGVICGQAKTYIAGNTITSTNTGTLVTFDTASKVIECGSGGTAMGVVYETYALNDTVPVWPLHGRHYVRTTATVTAADYLKPGAGGALAPEATVTTRTADTVGQAETTGSGAAAAFWAELGV
jgi:hypothetical protein